MERKLQERMVGAAVLILALVVLGPMVLDGGSESIVEVDVPGQRGDELRTHTFQLDRPPAARPPAADAAPIAPAQMPATTAAGTPAVPAATAAAPAETVEKAAEPARPQPEPAAASQPPAAPAGVAAVAVAPSPAPKAAASAPPAGGAWVVQVGTFGQKDNADRLVTKLKGSGFAAVVSPTTRSGKTMYRVRVGPAGTREATADVARRLAAGGQSGQVVPQ